MSCPHIKLRGVATKRLLSIDLTGELEYGERITSVAAAVSPSGATASEEQASTTQLTINGKPVAAGQAATLFLENAAADVTYCITLTYSTDRGQTGVEFTFKCTQNAACCRE